MFQIGSQRFRTRANQNACRTRRIRDLFRMVRSHPLLATATIATVGDEASGLHLDHRDIGDKLLMLANLSQSATALRTAVQFRFFRLMHLLQARHFSSCKLALASLASRPFGMFHPLPTRKRCGLPFPGTFQLFHFSLQQLHLLLQLLNGRQSLSQLLSQLGNLLILSIRKVVLFMSRLLRHLNQQCTFSSASSTRVVLPLFLTNFDPFQKITFER